MPFRILRCLRAPAPSATGVAVVLLALAFPAAPCVAQTAARVDRAIPLAGSYTAPAAAADSVRIAAERAVADMNFVVRQVARRRLITLNRPASRVVIDVRGDSLLLRYAEQPELRVGRTGTERPWQNADGETLRVTAIAPAAAPDSTPLLVER